MPDVCLVLMPYAAIERPSIALGILQASLINKGITAQSLYPNIWFAETIGIDVYQKISVSDPDKLIGEWTFSAAAFPEFSTETTQYINLISDSVQDRAFLEELLLYIRKTATSFIDSLAHHIIDLQPRIVSCSSMFQQHCASLALLKKIRELNPEIVTIMGGANCEGTMGEVTQRKFPWVDFICSGEGDDVFSQLCGQILQTGRNFNLNQLPRGVITAQNNNSRVMGLEAPRASATDLDKTPIPNYDDYFQTLKKSFLSTFIEPGIPVETSRGCWWGQKSHCTFCGLNGSGITYRSKSPQRVIQEFDQLAQSYGISKFQVVDNILDIKHINTVFPALTQLSDKYNIFYETKANLKKEQLKTLTQAGVFWLQPGIESLDDSALKLLRKGNNTSINIQFLKWSQELGIKVYWNILMGMPEEQDDWYVKMMQWLPLISHFQPPSSTDWIRYDRFSPYFEQPEQWNLQLSPSQAYFYVYPLDEQSMTELAYYFEDKTNNKLSPESSPLFYFHQSNYAGRIAVKKWAERWLRLFYSPKRPILNMVDNGKNELEITDTRPCSTQEKSTLSGLAYWIYRSCDRSLTPQELLHTLHQEYDLNTTWEEIQPILQQLCDRKLMLQISSRFLSLALNNSTTELPNNKQAPGGYLDIPGFQEFVRQRIQAQRTA
ncbi:MAG: RiPP maturation radical SAM C-methyltransferase [Pleurocapsa sp.]